SLGTEVRNEIGLSCFKKFLDVLRRYGGFQHDPANAEIARVRTIQSIFTGVGIGSLQHTRSIFRAFADNVKLRNIDLLVLPLFSSETIILKNEANLILLVKLKNS